MATLIDLISEDERFGSSFPQGTWFATVVAPLPALTTDKVFVTIPDIDRNGKWGPCRWSGNSLPILGSDALVIFDNKQNPWVIVWP